MVFIISCHSVTLLYDHDDDNFIAIYMYITRHTCNGMQFAPELLCSYNYCQLTSEYDHLTHALQLGIQAVAGSSAHSTVAQASVSFP